MYATQLQSLIDAQGPSVPCGLQRQAYVCLLPTKLDIARTALFNGAAEPSADASDDYRQQAQGGTGSAQRHLEVSAEPLAFRFAGATDVGLVRRRNEDAWLARGDIGLWAVADGMGGHETGDLASGTICSALGALSTPTGSAALMQSVIDTLNEVNRTLIETAGQRGSGVIIGSTAVVLLVHGRHFAGLWAGDSQFYRYRDGLLAQISRDHSHVQDMVDAELSLRPRRNTTPLSNVLTRAVGAQPNLILDKLADGIQENDVFLLCTDGLFRMVAAEQITEIIRETTIELLPRALIDAALAGGGRDNVTVVAVKCVAA